MASSRIRIVPPYRARGMFGFAAIAGTLSGLVFNATPNLGTSVHWFISEFMLLVGVFCPFLLGLGFAAGLPWITQRVWRVAALSAVFWVAMMVAYGLAPSSIRLDAGASLFSVEGQIALLVAAVMGALFGSALGLVSRWITRSLFFRAEEQDGQWCWKCTYRTGSERIAVCPECGTPIDPNRFRLNWLHRVTSFGRRFGWLGVGAFAAALVLWYSANWSTRIAPAMAATSRLEKLGRVEAGPYFAPGAAPTSMGENRLATRQLLDESASLDLVIIDAPASAGSTTMQLRVEKVTSKTAHSRESLLGVPRVLCDLNEQQAAEVIAHGVPQSLRDAMLKASAIVGWQNWSGPGPVPADVRIDPGPHFAGP